MPSVGCRPFCWGICSGGGETWVTESHIETDDLATLSITDELLMDFEEALKCHCMKWDCKHGLVWTSLATHMTIEPHAKTVHMNVPSVRGICPSAWWISTAQKASVYIVCRWRHDIGLHGLKKSQ